jgi:hypothetical protein
VKQQINLYQPMFRKQEKIFSALTMLQITGFFIVVLSGIYAYNVNRLKPFSVELRNTNAQLEKLSKQIEVVSRSLASRGKNKLMESEITRLTMRLENMQKIRSALSEGSFGNASGFSTLFEALARNRVDGAWLTEITISDGGGKLALSGKSIDPELVPIYIKRLAQAPVFKNQNFNILELERITGARDLIGFNISSGGS